HDLQHTFTNHESLIGAGNVATLLPAWSFATGDAVSASPAVVAGVVYIGSWDGYFYALDAATGALKWKFKVDCPTVTSGILPVPADCPGGPSAPQDRAQTDGGVITGSAAVVDGKVYVAGGKTVYCLSATTLDGTNPDTTPKPLLLWKTVICGNPEGNP